MQILTSHKTAALFCRIGKNVQKYTQVLNSKGFLKVECRFSVGLHQNKPTHRLYVGVFLHAVGVTQTEVAPDAQAGWSQVKGHRDDRAFLTDLHVFRVPVCKAHNDT